MESIILPMNTTTPTTPNLSQNSRNAAPKLNNDAYLKRLCKLGHLTQAISHLETSSSTSVSPNTLSHLIQSCTDSNSLPLCHRLHSHLRLSVKPLDPFLQTKLVSMFAKCGSLVDAYAVFDEMPVRNLYTWSAMIGACSREKRWGDVVELFYRMMVSGDAVPDDFLNPKILQACGNLGDVETGRLVHGIVIKCGMTDGIRVNNSILAAYTKCGWLSSAKKVFDAMEVVDVVSWNALISGYCNAGKVKDARRVFEVMRRQGFEPDVITWNVLISAVAKTGNCDVAMKLMDEMQGSGIKPDVFTWTSMIFCFVNKNRRLEAMKLFRDMLVDEGVGLNDVALMSAISVCSASKDIVKGKEVHSVAVKMGYGEDVLVGNSLIDMYSKSGDLEASQQIFDKIPEKDVCTWNSMIGGYYQGGYCGVAHDLFKKMQGSDILPNVITLNVMITGYIQNGEEDQAMDLFRNMEKKWGIKPDTASWNAFIAGYVQHGDKNKAFGIFRQMQSAGMKPNSVTILSILPACANLIAMNKVKEMHCCILRNNLESDLSVSNSLIDAYAKSGNISYSKAVFDGNSSMDIITWNTMLNGFVLHGISREAIELFECMRKLECRPNRSTFASIISAYGLARMVDEGRHIFTTMTEEHQSTPCLDHYVAMVNLYGRSGKLDKAFEFINSMGVELDAAVWYAFLMACCRHKHVKFAIYAAEKLLELEPDNVFIRRLLSKLCDFCGIPNDSSKSKRSITITRKDDKKCLGHSWTEEKNIVRTFVTGDFQQMDGESIRSWIRSTELKKKETKDHEMISIEEEETEATAGIHSEKLALALALIKSPPMNGRPVRIVKSLRMCDQCHRFAKLASKFSSCEIQIRDSACLHSFKEGICSCGDYW